MFTKKGAGFAVLFAVVLALLVYTLGGVLTGNAVVTSFDVDLAVGESATLFGQEILYQGQRAEGALVAVNGFSKVVPFGLATAYPEVMVRQRPLRDNMVRLTVSPRTAQTGHLSPTAQYSADLSTFPHPFLRERRVAGEDVWRKEKVVIVVGEDPTSLEVRAANSLAQHLGNLADSSPVRVLEERGSQDVNRNIRQSANVILIGQLYGHTIMQEVVDPAEIRLGQGYLRVIPSTEYAMLVVSGASDADVAAAVDALIANEGLSGVRMYV